MSKDTIKEVKRQHTAWENIFVNNIFHMGFISRIHEEFLQLKINRQVTNLKWARILNRHFSKANTQMTNKNIKNVQHQ